MPDTSPRQGKPESLFSQGQNSKENQPEQAHCVPVPGGDINGDLANLHALEPAQRAKAKKDCGHAHEQVGGMQAGKKIEEDGGRREDPAEGIASRRSSGSKRGLDRREKSSPARRLRPAREECDSAPAGPSPATPPARRSRRRCCAAPLHRQATEQQKSGIQKQEGGSGTGCQSPAGSWLRGSDQRMAMKGKGDGDEHREGHHIGGKRGEEKEAHTAQQLARTVAAVTPLSSPPPPPSSPPPVGRERIGGSPPIPGARCCFLPGLWVEMAGIRILCEVEITPTSP